MENFKPLQVDFEVLRRSRNKGEEKEERLGQLTHWEGLEGDRGVKKNFRTLCTCGSNSTFCYVFQNFSKGLHYFSRVFESVFLNGMQCPAVPQLTQI